MPNINFDLSNLLLNEQPQFLKNWVEDFSSLISWKEIEICMNSPEMYGIELIDPNNKKLMHSPTVLEREKQFLFDCIHNGHGLVINGYGNYSNKTKNFLKVFEDTFDVNAQIHVYCGLTSNATSFNIHCDSPTNFILQIEGECRWKVYKNRMSNLLDFFSSPGTVQSEINMETEIDVVLSPGDGLLIPPRQYHLAMPNQRRISISIPCWPRAREEKTINDRNFYKLNIGE